MILTGEKVRLRPLEPDDLEFLYLWENDPRVWRYGDCGAGVGADSPEIPDAPRERFSRDVLREFIENQQHDIYRTLQMRLVICRLDPDIPVGFIDLFDLDPVNLGAGVGILICDEARRRKGYAREALGLVVDHARHILGLRELRCSIAVDNTASLALFSGAGFVRTGEGSGGPDEIALRRVF